ncbi:hypothetical protein I4U23_004653 [Adineta vaga]|nr:hypothetical protein I4U23_004653 [Adineta vaga]
MYTVDVRSAVLFPSTFVNISQKRIDRTQSTMKGDILIVDFYLAKCNNDYCPEEQVAKIKSNLISVMFSLVIKLDDGTVRTINTNFYSSTSALFCTDVDCGGTICSKKCDLNQRCAINKDCANGNCHAISKTCQAPSCTDGNKNQDEIDVDCGGTTCLTICSPNQPCTSNIDCSNGNCDVVSKICVDLFNETF